MSRPVLKLKTPLTRWYIEASFLIDVPQSFEADDLDRVRMMVQQLAIDADKKREEATRLGQIGFRYETNEKDEVTIIHCYFIARTGKRARFMRLHRA